MSPDTTELWQEGALIHSEFLIRDGEFNLKAIEEYLSGACRLLCAKTLPFEIADQGLLTRSAPGRFPGVSPALRVSVFGIRSSARDLTHVFFPASR